MDNEPVLNGYQEYKIQFNMLWLNIFAFIVLIIFTALLGGPFYLIWGINNASIQKFGLELFIVYIFGIVIHELIHGLFFVIFSKNKFKSVKFGIKPKHGAAYCICTEPLKIKHFIIVTIMPAIILGFIPGLISLILGNIYFLVFSLIFIMGASGDFLVIFKMIKENKEDYAIDKLGVEKYIHIYRKIETSKKR